jgi:hypothetical protein
MTDSRHRRRFLLGLALLLTASESARAVIIVPTPSALAEQRRVTSVFIVVIHVRDVQDPKAMKSELYAIASKYSRAGADRFEVKEDPPALPEGRVEVPPLPPGVVPDPRPKTVPPQGANPGPNGTLPKSDPPPPEQGPAAPAILLAASGATNVICLAWGTAVWVRRRRRPVGAGNGPRAVMKPAQDGSQGVSPNGSGAAGVATGRRELRSAGEVGEIETVVRGLSPDEVERLAGVIVTSAEATARVRVGCKRYSVRHSCDAKDREKIVSLLAECDSLQRRISASRLQLARGGLGMAAESFKIEIDGLEEDLTRVADELRPDLLRVIDSITEDKD